MNQQSEQNGRFFPSLWPELFRQLPFTIRCDLHRGYYHIQDSEQMIIWGDDLWPWEYPMLIGALSVPFCKEDRRLMREKLRLGEMERYHERRETFQADLLLQGEEKHTVHMEVRTLPKGAFLIGFHDPKDEA